MRDLWAEGNPFLREYTEYDYWCYANAGEPDWDELQACWEGEAGPRMHAVRIEVSGDGYVLPQLAAFRQVQESRLGREPEEGEEEEDSCTVAFWAYGELEPEVLADFERAMCGIWAEYVPPVPAWLAAAPPKMAVLLSDGEVVARGEPDSGSDYAGDWWSAVTEDDPWIRYSPGGQELGRAAGSGDWCELYFPDYARLKREAEQQQHACYEHKGYVMVFDTANWELLAAYDYRGAPVALTREEIWAAPWPYEQVGGKHVALLRQAQLEKAPE